MKKKFRLLVLWAFLLLIIPINIYAYSNYIIPGGNNIGIEVNSNGVLIVGFYKVDGKFIAKDTGFLVGDTILEVNNEKINNIDEMVNVIKEKEKDEIEFKVKRENVEKRIKLKVTKDENDVYKTGMYVKDKIVGIGTLTYIDPNTKKFGALGHEIDERRTAKKFEIKDGKIFNAKVTGIERSESGNAGEKNASYDKSVVYGNVTENSESGIFGDYLTDLPNNESIKVATPEEVKTGSATIKTVVSDNKIEDFEINILRVDEKSDTKNILFEVTDKKLLEISGGIVQGMSGSPIIQNNMIVGAVTHVIVNETNKGYGIFITTMLEEGDN